MARDRKRHARDREVPSVAPPADAMSLMLQPSSHHVPIRLSLIKAAKLPTRHRSQSQNLVRIRSCLQTVAALLETNHVYLPIFLRLEKELEAEQLKQDAISRARKYLSTSS